ncbi:DUF6029 family protein [uncultured Prevotella sp.]|uniref:DUF6029 family protein n=1 Tax=uncultured Prevotella sp. TaxID=159272 RepID=UPI0026336CA5|nr:DUF6029 family protein [uncultured Prevotella sp.]
MKPRIFFSLAAVLAATGAMAQEDAAKDKFTVSGSIQSDVIIPQEDEAIGTDKYSEWALTNTYADIMGRSNHLDAGLRFEFTKHPLPGYATDPEQGFKGYGVPHFYLKTHFDNWDLTLGTFYEQFGSGFILRTYEERSLGIDNSLLGGRLVVRPVKGVQVKALAGKQRNYWKWNDAWVTGGDLELSVDQWFKKMQEHNTYLTLAGSWVNKYQSTKDEEINTPYGPYKLNLPSNVNAFDVRANLQAGDFSVLAEYAWKTDDPSYDALYPYIYRKGTVAMLSTSYSRNGLSLLLQAKRSDNMTFRSDRNVKGLSSNLNNLPAFTQEQTYALAALYPYATQPNGEWAYQAEFGYRFKRNTFLGGKYGTNLKVNFSHVHSIDRNLHTVDGYSEGTSGYGSAFWKWGDATYYQDLNVHIDKKFSRSFTLNLMYMNQFYNKSVVEGEGGMVHSDIFVADAKYRFNNKVTLRGEAQYLNTDDDEGDWLFGLLELSVLPHWMITVSDMYNSGVSKLHYYQGLVTFNAGAHRLQIGYGRTRAGYNCSGGVCRMVPASKGVTLSYNYNF